MKLYLDTADLEQIRDIDGWGVLDGVTTNPSLIAEAGKDFHDTVTAICELIRKPVSAEVTTEDAEEMVEQGRRFADWHQNIVVKLPTTEAGLRACHKLANLNIDCNLTLCFSVNQALLCARAGARYVSPFIGRLEDINHNGMSVVTEIREMFRVHRLDTEIIAASIRSPEHVRAAAMAGAHVATMPYRIFKQLILHPLTDSGQAKFLSDYRSRNDSSR
jgi:transaldolase